MEPNLQLSLILPCYNEAPRIENTVRDMTSYFSEHLGTDFAYELILVNDGSQDNTGEIIGQLEQKYPRVKAVSYEQNGGK